MGPRFANFTGFFVKIGPLLWNFATFYANEFSRPQVLYRATFELCGLEIGHLATVESSAVLCIANEQSHRKPINRKPLEQKIVFKTE